MPSAFITLEDYNRRILQPAVARYIYEQGADICAAGFGALWPWTDLFQEELYAAERESL